MATISEVMSTQVGKKLINGITGFLLFLFIIIHLMGNLSYFAGAETLNRYSYTLHELGPLLWIARLGLIAFFLFHIYSGLQVYWSKKKARPDNYKAYKTRGGQSLQTWSSRSMALTGILLLIFIVFHLQTFALADMGTAVHGGTEMTDVYGQMTMVFSQLHYVVFYVLVMVLLGMHLRHGVWSSLQSLGLMSPRFTKRIHGISLVIGVILAAGFIALPIFIYLSQI